MNKYTICFTTIQNGKRHTYCEEFKADNEFIAEAFVRDIYRGVEIMSIELSQYNLQ